MENVSPTVLLRMIEYLQAELNAANERIEQVERIHDAQARVIRTLRSDLSTNESQLGVYVQGNEILVRAIEGMYQHAKHLFLIQRLEVSEWDEFMRQMMRADIGFAIINHVDFFGLNAQEILNDADTEVDEDETEDEMETSE